MKSHLSDKKLILGNIYRPPRDLHANYELFIEEFSLVLQCFEKSNYQVLIAGDFNIDLLRIHEKPMFARLFDTITSLIFFRKLHFLLDFPSAEVPL